MGALVIACRDGAEVQVKRIARDRVVAEDAAQNARRLGIRVIEVDGTLDAAAVAAAVAAAEASPSGPDLGRSMLVEAA
ncbi:hypothetical protein [Streptomyces sp. NPDC058683]|uniref:hypothetical protein n=1 Tax=Streptomyces sp. NPDC058683 TaxID=3346597 RepID=UPI003660CB1A